MKKKLECIKSTENGHSLKEKPSGCRSICCIDLLTLNKWQDFNKLINKLHLTYPKQKSGMVIT